VLYCAIRAKLLFELRVDGKANNYTIRIKLARLRQFWIFGLRKL